MKYAALFLSLLLLPSAYAEVNDVYVYACKFNRNSSHEAWVWTGTAYTPDKKHMENGETYKFSRGMLQGSPRGQMDIGECSQLVRRQDVLAMETVHYQGKGLNFGNSEDCENAFAGVEVASQSFRKAFTTTDDALDSTYTAIDGSQNRVIAGISAEFPENLRCRELQALINR